MHLMVCFHWKRCSRPFHCQKGHKQNVKHPLSPQHPYLSCSPTSINFGPHWNLQSTDFCHTFAVPHPSCVLTCLFTQPQFQVSHSLYSLFFHMNVFIQQISVEHQLCARHSLSLWSLYFVGRRQTINK